MKLPTFLLLLSRGFRYGSYCIVWAMHILLFCFLSDSSVYLFLSQSGKFGKLNKRVIFPEVLNMKPYMSGMGDKPPSYKLYAVVVNLDMMNDSFSGHYVCYVKNLQGAWYKIDDSKVSPLNNTSRMNYWHCWLFYVKSQDQVKILLSKQGTILLLLSWVVTTFAPSFHKQGNFTSRFKTRLSFLNLVTSLCCLYKNNTLLETILSFSHLMLLILKHIFKSSLLFFNCIWLQKS